MLERIDTLNDVLTLRVSMFNEADTQNCSRKMRKFGDSNWVHETKNYKKESNR